LRANYASDLRAHQEVLSSPYNRLILARRNELLKVIGKRKVPLDWKKSSPSAFILYCKEMLARSDEDLAVELNLDSTPPYVAKQRLAFVAKSWSSLTEGEKLVCFTEIDR
jgi:hypothetical protein